MKTNVEDRVLGKSMPKPFCRWWLKTRPCKLATQINQNEGISPCIEFYVPLWALPFEILHRVIFGSTKIK